MNYILTAFVSCILLLQTALFAQNTEPYILQDNLTQAEFDSIYQTIMNVNYEAYQTWQAKLPKLRKQRITKNIIVGASFGGILGAAGGSALQGFCGTFGGRKDCHQGIIGTALGITIGGLLGRWTGKKRAQKMKFY
ncbi:MAG: hypothetical protein AAGJ18_31195, partial [Bacteroidota bacterium]